MPSTLPSVTIGSVTSPVLVHGSLPVCTTRQLARFYGCTTDNLNDNFANNRQRFEEGKHFVKLEGEALREFKRDIPDDFGDVGERSARLLLWTEKGAARHAKMLTTEAAWEVFEALEDRYFRPANDLPVPRTLPEALRLAADAMERTALAEAERDQAIATKALIGSKREATAMATASRAVREAAGLREALGFNAHHATMIAVEHAAGREFGPQDWRKLKRWCTEHGQTAPKVPDKRYGEATAWPADAWREVFDIDLGELFAQPEAA